MDRGRKLHVTGHKIGTSFHHINYYTDIIGLYFDTFYVDNAGYIRSWEAVDSENSFSGNDLRSFIEYIGKLICYYKPTRTEKNNIITEDIIVVYTDNVYKVAGFLQPLITEAFSNYYFRIGCIEFRDIKAFGGSISDIYESLKAEDEFNTEATLIAKFFQKLVDTVFVPEKNFYITPNQRVHKILAKACGKYNLFDIAPKSFAQYSVYRKAYFGGLCFSGVDRIHTNKVMFDRKSAYIYDMLIEKHCRSSNKIVDPSTYMDYINNDKYLSIGKYRIKATLTIKQYKLLKCFKNDNGAKIKAINLVKNDYTIDNIYTLTSVDLYNIMHIIGEDISIECIWLNVFEADYLPYYFIDTAVNFYINKENVSKLYSEGKATKFDKVISKQCVNGLYGSCAKRINTEEEYKYYRKYNCIDTIQWALFITSYAKKNLLDLALNLSGWEYSDTDCIIVDDTPENRAIIDAYNTECRAKIKAFCNEFGYNYDDLKNLGCFMEDKKMPEFKNIGVKQYMWHDEKGKFHLKAAGLNQDSIDIIEEDWWAGKITYGRHKFPHWNTGFSQCVVNGVTYSSPCSYYETEEYITEDNIQEIISKYAKKSLN